MVRKPLRSFALAAALATAATSAPSFAAVIVIDENDGILADAILDGVPFGPPNDGIPDAGGNALAVALNAGVTEQRAILEIPLAALAGLTGDDIDSATLTLNIDDVIGTFGPGFDFDGTAAQAIFLWAWSGNGVIDLSDFDNVVGAPTGTVVTGADGSITDATLADTGPLAFAVDLTAALQSLLDASADYMGVTLAVNDDQTATSIDDLGLGAAGPPGVGGARLPFLTVVTVEAAPPVLTRDEVKCQTKIGAFAGKYATTVEKNLRKCVDGVLKDLGKGKDTARSLAKCAKGLDPDPASKSSVSKARARAEAGIEKACSGLVPSALGSPCDEAASGFAATATCVLDAASDGAQATIRSAYASSCAVLAAAGFEADYQTTCTQP